MGAKYGISTTVLARQAFGRYGSGLFGIVLALTLGIGWFGWQVAFSARPFLKCFRVFGLRSLKSPSFGAVF